MGFVAENLKAAIKAFGTSENALAEATGVSQSVSGDTRDPRESNLKALADWFGIQPHLFRNATSEEFKIFLDQALRERVGKAFIHAYKVRAVDGLDGIDPSREAAVDEVEIEVSGGPGAWVPEYVETKFQMPFQLYWFRDKGAKPENVKLMRVTGSSMERTLFDGDRVAVDTGNKTIIDDHVYVLWSNGAKVKRLFRRSDGALRIVSDNPDKDRYPDEVVPAVELDSVLIIGRVIDKSGSGGL